MYLNALKTSPFIVASTANMYTSKVERVGRIVRGATVSRWAIPVSNGSAETDPAIVNTLAFKFVKKLEDKIIWMEFSF